MENNDSPFIKWIYLARALDSWRIFPRTFIVVYLIILHDVIQWFIGLDEPNNAQASLVSVVVGAGAAWFGLYVNTGGGKTRE